MDNNVSELAKGMEHLKSFLNGLNLDELPQDKKEEVENIKKEANKKMAEMKRELMKMAKNKSKF